jgi:transmembrane sensor
VTRASKTSDNEELAAAWLVRLEADTSATTMASWEQWLRDDARHHVSFARLENSWRRMDCLRSVRPLDGTVDLDLLDDAPGAQARPAGGDASGTCVEPSGSAGSPVSFIASHLSGATIIYRSIAVALAAGALSSLLVFAGWLFLTRPDRAIHRTELGGFERVLLPDGSTASLNTNSEIRIQFTRQRRRILLTRGEALFAVAHDDTRPFEVAAGGNTVRAVGTSFDVRLRAYGQVEVLVTQGRVALDLRRNGESPLTSDSRGALLTSGDDALIDTKGPPRTKRINPSDIEHRLAWTRGQIWLNHSTLAEAIAEFNRYRGDRSHPAHGSPVTCFKRAPAAIGSASRIYSRCPCAPSARPPRTSSNS